MLSNFKSKIDQLWLDTSDFRIFRTSQSEIILQILAIILLKELSKSDLYKYQIPEELHFSKLMECDTSASDSLASHINDAFQLLEKLISPLLDGLTKHIDFRALYNNDDEFVSSLFDAINTFSQSFEGAEEGSDLKSCIPYLIDYFTAQSPIRTVPLSVSILTSQLLDIGSHDVVCDPFCGDGALLRACAKDNLKLHLSGQDPSPIQALITRVSLFLQGIDDPHIALGNAISDPKFTSNKSSLTQFDVVLSYPPAPAKDWPYDMAVADKFNRFKRGVPPRYKGDLAYLLHMLSSMKPTTSRAAVIMPQGMLYRGGPEYTIRKSFIDDNILDTVIRLPSGVFNGTALPMVILVFKQLKNDTKVLFIDASLTKKSRSNVNKLDESECNLIADSYRQRNSVEGFAYLADNRELIAQDYNLNISRYVTPVNLVSEPSTLLTQHKTLQVELLAIQEEIEQHLSEILSQ